MKKAATWIAIVLLVLAAGWLLLPRSSDDHANPEAAKSPQQMLYEECVAARDREIHEKTFATIDNPDVQREILATQKEIAKRECRDKYL